MTIPSDASQAVELPPLNELIEELDAAYAKVTKISGSALLAGEKRCKHDAPALYSLACEAHISIHYVKEALRDHAAAIAQDRAARAQAEPVAYLVDWADIGEGASRSLFYDEEAKKHMEGAVSHGNSIGRPSVVTPLYTAPTIPQAAEVPGFVLVPREPTREMLNTWALKMPAAVFTEPEGKNRVLGWSAVDAIWRDMLAAAPTPTASAPHNPEGSPE